MGRPYWVDEHGRRVPTRSCHVPTCTREWPIPRYRFEHLDWTGWPTKPMFVADWCGHGQEFVPWPDADGLWALVVVEATANRLRRRSLGRSRLVDGHREGSRRR